MRRLRFGTVVLLLMFAVIAGRLVELQLTDAKAYAADALRQRLSTIVLHAPRGSILDANGAVLAHSVEARYVAVDPHMLENVNDAAARLSPLLGVPASELRDRMKCRNRADGTPNRFVYLARGVDIEVGDQVKALNIMGVRVDYDERREAPGHDLAANVLGFISRDGRGLAGMEARHDELLRGVDGEDTFEVGGTGNRRQIPDGYRRYVPARPGSSLQLTLDRDLQFEAQQALANQMKAAGASFGAAVVLDVRTGAVLALASYPTFSASDPFNATSRERTDYATAAVVEPGSVHKAIVMGAALEEGIVRPDTSLVVTPTIRKGGVTYRDTHSHPTARMTMPGIMAHSSNVGTILLADHLGAQRLYEYQRSFGLGQRTNVGVPGEAAGLVQAPDRWSGSSHGSIPIGLGVAATPLQMASAYAAIANDGVWVQPRLVRGTVDPAGALTAAGPSQQRRVLSTGNARALQQMLEAVVTADGGTGRKAAVPGYRVAGKTGTGMRVVNNSYLPGNVASFVGMAPAENPQYVVAVFAQAGKQAGGTLAAPVFSDIMSFTLRQHRVPPSGTEPPEFRIYA